MAAELESSNCAAHPSSTVTKSSSRSSYSSPVLAPPLALDQNDGPVQHDGNGEPPRVRARWSGAVLEWVALTGVVLVLRLIVSADDLSFQTLSAWTAKGLCHGGLFQGLTCLGQMPQF